MYDGFHDNYGIEDGPALCWRAATSVMNPFFDKALIAREIAKDPAKNSAEYPAEFRSDISGFISREELEACVSPGCYERAPVLTTKYLAFVDMAGGGYDEHTIAISHRHGDKIIVDAIRARNGSPEAAVTEFSELMKSYGVSLVKGDNYAKAWPQESFKRHGILYVRADQVRSDIYIAAAQLIRSGRAELLDHPKSLLQFTCLELKTSPAGRDQVNHPPGGRDDACNAVAGALVLASTAPAAIAITMPFVDEKPRAQRVQDIPSIPFDPAVCVDPLRKTGPEYASSGSGDWISVMAGTARLLK